MKRLIKVGALCKSEMKKNMKFQNQPKYSGSDLTNDGRSESTSRETSWVFANPFIIRATLSFHQSVSSTAKTNDVNYYHHFFSQKKTVFTKRYTEKRTRTQSFPYERKSEAKKRQRMRWSQFAISWDLALTNSLTIASSISLIFSNYMLKLGAS